MESALMSSSQVVGGIARRSNPTTCHRSSGVAASVRRSVRPCRASQDRNPHVMYTDSNVEPPREFETVGDVMTEGVLTVFEGTPVIEALQIVVDKRITGMPVVDEDGKVVGVVSDFDLLALDLVSLQNDNVFPPPGQSWQTFNEVRRLIEKVEGQNVEDVMTADPVVVRSETSLNSAAKILLESKIRRLPVVDKNGVLVGLLTRRDVVVAALKTRQQKSMNNSS
ncbi:hypothetical protein BSKO_03521 [Bryopsis sp. KO-2023]|nr:hypothetical protein BSKO_03521 [Bryopsis sp. KO-2023]